MKAAPKGSAERRLIMRELKSLLAASASRPQ
jgi:hypothetical protein